MLEAGRRAAGERIAHFEIVQHLASGGMGDVYEAVDARSGETVALKVLRDPSPLSMVRFEREGRIAAQLHHPHIASVRARGRADDGTLFIAMELLRGEDLSHLLARGRTPVAAVVEVGLQVCDALEYAHARGVVHRDLKPENIFLVHADTLDSRVLDFGIARVAGERGLTKTGGIIGTLDYLSPEQARSERDIDLRTDLWSLGVVLYEALAGRVPFVAETVPSLLFAITLHDPPRLGALAPDAPQRLVAIVERLLSKRREDRLPSARALRDALLEFASPSARRSSIATNNDAANVVTTSATVLSLVPSPAEESDHAQQHDEQRPVAAVYLRQVRDRLLVSDLARENAGEAVPIGGEGMLVVFGLIRWDGDELERAVRFALQAAIVAARIGVAAGRVVRGGDGAVGGAIDAAVAVARSEGIWLDATTAAAMNAAHVIEESGDGRYRLDPRASRPPAASGAQPVATPFVGRDVERTLLLGAVDTALTSNTPTAVVVIGAPGMGKTRLRAEAIAAIEENSSEATVMQARCDANDASFVAIRDLCATFGGDSIDRVFRSVLEHGGDPQLAMDRVRSTLESVLRGAAVRGPVVIAIDDAQWLDGASRAALRWIGENVGEIPLGVWLFARPEGRDPLRDVFANATVRELPPLGAKAAADLVQAIIRDAPAALLDRAAGLPLALEELARVHARSGPESLHGSSMPLTVESAILAQIDRLEPADRTALKCASVFGRSACVEGIVALGAESAGVAGLRRLGFVSPRPRARADGLSEFTIRSGLVQEVAYGLWTDKQRSALHARAAEWLRDTAGASADEVARHFESAGDRDSAAEAYVRAAENAARAGDEDLAQHVTRALALATDPRLRFRVLVAYDDVLQLGTNRAAQKRGLEEATQLAAQLGDAERAEIGFRRAYHARITAAHDDALNIGLEAIVFAERCGRLEWAAAAENEIAVVLANEGRFDEAHVHARRSEAFAAATGNESILARSLVTRAYVIGEEGRDVDEAIAMHDRAAEEYRRVGDRRREAIASSNAGHSLLKVGRIAEALERFDAAIALSQRVANARTLAVATLNRGTVYRMIGEWDRARADLEYSDRRAQRVGYVRLLGSVATERAYLALCTSRDPNELIAAADEALRRAPATQSPMLVLSAESIAARARAAAGCDVQREVAALRDQLASPDLAPDTRAEVAVAVWEAGGKLDVDRAVALDALELWIATVARITDRDDCRAAFTMRFATDVAVRPE